MSNYALILPGPVATGPAPSATQLAWMVYNSGTPTPADGNQLPLQSDASGNLKVNVVVGGGGGGGGTVTQGNQGSIAQSWFVEVTDGTYVLGTSTHALRIDPTGTTVQPVDGALTHNNAAPAGTNLGVLPALANAAAPTYTEGDQVLLSTNLAGNLRVTGAVTNAGTFAVQDTVLDAAIIAQEASTSGVKGLTVFGAVTTSAPSYSTGKSDALSLDTAGNLRVIGTVTPGGSAIFEVSPTTAANTVSNPFFTEISDGTHGVTINSNTYTSKYGLDINLLGTLGAAFSTAGKIDIKAANGDAFVEIGDGTHAVTLNSTTYTAKYGLDVNLLGTLGTAFSTPGKIDVTGTLTAVTAITNALPSGTNTLGSIKLTDGTNTAAVKAASTAAVATDPALVVTEPGSTTAGSCSNTAVSSSSASILSANTARREVLIVNTDAVTVYIGLGQTPSATAYHVALAPCSTAHDGTGGIFVSDVFKGQINAIVASTGGHVAVTELT